MSSNITERQQFAHAGLVLLGNTTKLTTPGFAVEFIEDTVIESLEGAAVTEQGLALSAVTWLAGRILYIRFESIKLTSGKAIVYKREV